MEKNRECCKADALNLWGKTPEPRLVAIAFVNRDPEGWGEIEIRPDASGRIDLSGDEAWHAIKTKPPRGGFNMDFFYQGSNGFWHGADQTHRPLLNKPMTTFRLTHEAFKEKIRGYQAANDFDTFVICAVCQQAFDPHPSQKGATP